MADILNKKNVDESFSNESLAIETAAPEVYKDLKTTTVDATVKEIIENYLSKDIIEGIIEFPGQILRVEERRDRFQRSYLDNLGAEINRDFPRRYKVKVILIDDLKKTPEKFDETSEDKARIDQYNDFIYIPASFGNAEPMNVGDFVMVTYANLKAKTDGRILYKISGASHARGTVGRPEVKKVSNPKKAFEQKKEKPEIQETDSSVKKPATETQDTTKQDPPPPEPTTPDPKPDSLSIRPFKRVGWYSVSGSNDEFDAFKEAMTTRFPSWQTHIEDYNTDKTKRENQNATSIQIDMNNLDTTKKAAYERCGLSGKNGEDDVYLRALADIIASKESSINYGWDMMYQSNTHLSVDKQIAGQKTNYYLKEFGQYPVRYGVISADANALDVHKLNQFSDVYEAKRKEFILNKIISTGKTQQEAQASIAAGNIDQAILTEAATRAKEAVKNLGIAYATSAAGRYQFLKGTWNDYSKGLNDFTPESQDLTIYEMLRRHPVKMRTPVKLVKTKNGKPQETIQTVDSAGALFEGDPEKLKEFNNADLTKKGDLRIKRIIELLKDGSEDAIEKLTYSLNNIWTSIPGGKESSSKIIYNKNAYTYTPKIFAAVYKKFLEDQKRPAGQRKFKDRQEIFNEAIKEMLLQQEEQKKADATPPSKPDEKKSKAAEEKEVK